MKRLACLLTLCLAQTAWGAEQTLPAVTVMPGSISMSGGASYDLLADLQQRLPPADYEATRQFFRDALVLSVRNKKVEMPLDLAQKLHDVRNKMEAEGKVEAVRSFDLSLGLWMRSALREAADSTTP